MIIVDIPTVGERAGRNWYETIPLSIIVTKTLIITVCMQDTPVLHPFMEGTIRGFNTFMRSRFILQILYRNATMYLRYLRIIDGETDIEMIVKIRITLLRLFDTTDENASVMFARTPL